MSLLLTDEEIKAMSPEPEADYTPGVYYYYNDGIRDGAKAQLKNVVEWILEHKETGFNKHGNVYIPPKEFEALLEEVGE